MSEFAFEQDPGGYVDSGGDESYGPGWDEEGGAPELDPFDEGSIRNYIQEQIAPGMQFLEQQRFEQAAKTGEAEAEKLIAEYGKENGIELDAGEVLQIGNAILQQVAQDVLQAAQQSGQLLSPAAQEAVRRGDAGQTLEALTGTPRRELVLMVLAEAQRFAHGQQPTRGDERGVLAKHFPGGPQASSRPSHPDAAALPQHLKDLIARA